VITAKVIVATKTQVGEAEGRQVTVAFTADYGDERNKEWALYTPALSLSMTLKGDVGDRFNPGDRFTLQFVKDDEEA
jgi:hypothetical protein